MTEQRSDILNNNQYSCDNVHCQLGLKRKWFYLFSLKQQFDILGNKIKYEATAQLVSQLA